MQSILGGRRGAPGAAGSNGANGYATLGGFVQPAVLATVSNVSYAGPSPGVGSYLDVIVSAAVAGRYLVTADTGTRVNLQLLSEGTVTAGNAVAASIALHAGATGATGAQGPSSSPDETDSFVLSGALDSDTGCNITLVDGHSYVIRFEITARTSTGPIYFAELTVCAYCSGGIASVDAAVETRTVYTDEIIVGAAYDGIGPEIWATVSQLSGIKTVTIKAFVESDAVY